MYSLDPWNDPHGALYHLDYLAFKGNMTGWLLEMFDLFKQRRQEKGVHINPSILPGWMYARALALRVSHDAKVSYSVDIDDFHRTFLSSNGN